MKWSNTGVWKNLTGEQILEDLATARQVPNRVDRRQFRKTLIREARKNNGSRR